MVKKILNCIYWLIIIALIGMLIYVYNTKFFNDYLKTMKKPVSSFSRSEEYPEFLENKMKSMSYKIQSDDYNNALFYKTLKVKKDTPYKVVCYVKTENVEYIINDEYKEHGIDYKGGANISIYGENDRSKSISGTNDWTKLEFMFDSRDNEEVQIAFRLGTDMCDSKGTAYFSNIKVYEGSRDENDKTINFGLFIFQNLDINVDGKQFKEYMTEEDKRLLRQDIDNFSSSIGKMTRGKIKPNIITKYFLEPVTKVSFDKDNGYYLDVYDVYDLIDNELNSYTYDHIFFVFKSDDLNKGNELKTNETDWVGLGGMFYNKLGYSNIRLPITYEHGRHMFIYDRNKNTFPEEVFVHEYLHSLESISEDYGYRYPSIHDYESFGYQNHSVSKLKNWYTDFLNQDITNKNIEEFYGLHEDVYKYANIVNREDFNDAHELDFDKEPENIIEAIKLLLKTINHNLKSIVNLIKGKDEVFENETYENKIYTNEVIVNVVN